MNRLPDIHTGQVVLVVAPHAAREGMLELAARLACRGSLRVLDGGNQFNAYLVARAVRRLTPDLPEIMERIALARAFTCYQLEALLAASPAQPEPTLVLDFLAMFSDENVRFAERRRLLLVCAQHLRRLSRQAPVVVSVRPAAPEFAERVALLEMVSRAADQTLEWEPPAALPAPQLRLF